MHDLTLLLLIDGAALKFGPNLCFISYDIQTNFEVRSKSWKNLSATLFSSMRGVVNQIPLGGGLGYRLLHRRLLVNPSISVVQTLLS